VVSAVSIETIMDMLSRNHKGILYSPDDIGQWCGEFVEDAGAFDSLELKTNEPIKIDNGLGNIPCNAYRVLKLNIPGNCLPNYVLEAPYLRIKGFTGTVSIDYLRVPLDDKGYPKIDAAARQGAYFYCLQKLKYDDFLNGKIAPIAWADITDNVEYYRLRAKGSMRNVTIDDTNKLSAVMYNMTRGVIAEPTYK
jgi:hypothetical protein